MIFFSQKNSFVTNFDADKRALYEKAIQVFQRINPSIKVWIEEEAFDSLGRPSSDLSLHSDAEFKGKMKWMKFYKNVNKQKLMSGELDVKKTVLEKILSWKIS